MAKHIEIPIKDVSLLLQYLDEYISRYSHRVRVLSELKGRLDYLYQEAEEMQGTVVWTLSDDERATLARMVENLPDDDANYFANLLDLEDHVDFEVEPDDNDASM